MIGLFSPLRACPPRPLRTDFHMFHAENETTCMRKRILFFCPPAPFLLPISHDFSPPRGNTQPHSLLKTHRLPCARTRAIRSSRQTKPWSGCGSRKHRCRGTMASRGESKPRHLVIPAAQMPGLRASQHAWGLPPSLAPGAACVLPQFARFSRAEHQFTRGVARQAKRTVMKNVPPLGS